MIAATVAPADANGSTRSRAAARVLLVEDHPLMRTVIKVACDRSSDLEVVGETDRGEVALEACRSSNPDVVVLDLSLAGELQGLELARRIRDDGLSTRILVLTARTDPRSVFDAMAAGVNGYLEKTVGIVAIADAVRRIAAGERIFTRSQLAGALDELGRRARQARLVSDARSNLSARELEVLELAAAGLTVVQVARRIGLSPRTVESHLANAYRKLGARNRVQAVSRAAELGLIEIG